MLPVPYAGFAERVRGGAVAFHDIVDPWSSADAIVAASRARDIPLHLTEGANHSLETGDVWRNMRTLMENMERIRGYIGEKPIEI